MGFIISLGGGAEMGTTVKESSYRVKENQLYIVIIKGLDDKD